MKTLLVRQVTTDGRSRTWRLRPNMSPSTLGSSRKARLSSLDQKSHGIEGVFEFRDNRWYWVSMTSCSSNVDPAQTLKNEDVIRMGQSQIHIALHEKEGSIFRALEARPASDSPYEIEIAKLEDRVLSSKVVKKGSGESKPVVQMRKIMGDRLIVTRTSVTLASAKELLKQDFTRNMDKESRRGAAIVAACALSFGALAVFGPKSTPMATMANFPPQSATIMFKTTVPKQVAASKPKAAAAPAAQPHQQPPEDSPSGNKVAGLLKSVSGGRLSRLLGKVSSQEARSHSVVVQNGIKANEGPSSTATGSFDSKGSKSDWANAAQGSGVTVSTAGHGGGRGIAGIGTLSAGATGQGGVGLIEDESEITGGLDREVIAQTIKTYLGQILYCYERQLSAHPDLFGKIAVRFTIGPNGMVESQKIGDTTLRNATVEGCILNKVASWKFPTPQGGTRVMVTYPFLFKSTN